MAEILGRVLEMFLQCICVLSSVFLVWVAYYFVEHLSVFFKTLPG